jgi:TPP-dependent pyruvate/acetoin dehydrogenase alpha subunit
METTPWDPEGVTAVLDHGGHLAADARAPAVDMRAYYKALVVARRIDARLGELGLPMWASSAGEEAPLVATALVARPEDWIYPGSRDTAVAVARGIAWDELARQVLGHRAHGEPALPARVSSDALHIAPTTDALGLHLAIAAGHAQGLQLAGEKAVTFALFGEGLTTTGPFAETVALATAGVLPLVLVCRSQQWPNGAPAEAGVLGDSVADRARAAGLWTRRVDGADPLAVYATIANAADRARQGRGPALVETVVTQLVHEPPAHRDPVERLRRHLETSGAWTETFQDVIEAEAVAHFDRALAAVPRAADRGTPG